MDGASTITTPEELGADEFIDADNDDDDSVAVEVEMEMAPEQAPGKLILLGREEGRCMVSVVVVVVVFVVVVVVVEQTLT